MSRKLKWISFFFLPASCFFYWTGALCVPPWALSFAEEVTSSLSIDEDAFFYDDEMCDEKTGLTYLFTRFYNNNGQFVSEDAFANKTPNPYTAFADDGPNRIDPLGKSSHSARNNTVNFFNHFGNTFFDSVTLGLFREKKDGKPAFMNDPSELLNFTTNALMLFIGKSLTGPVRQFFAITTLLSLGNGGLEAGLDLADRKGRQASGLAGDVAAGLLTAEFYGFLGRRVGTMREERIPKEWFNMPNDFFGKSSTERVSRAEKVEKYYNGDDPLTNQWKRKKALEENLKKSDTYRKNRQVLKSQVSRPNAERFIRSEDPDDREYKSVYWKKIPVGQQSPKGNALLASPEP